MERDGERRRETERDESRKRTQLDTCVKTGERSRINHCIISSRTIIIAIIIIICSVSQYVAVCSGVKVSTARRSETRVNTGSRKGRGEREGGGNQKLGVRWWRKKIFHTIALAAYLLCPVQLFLSGALPSYLIGEFGLALFNNMAATCWRNDINWISLCGYLHMSSKQLSVSVTMCCRCVAGALQACWS